jgi:hypothetical protein
MNKQELIKEFREIGIYGLNMFGTVVKGIPTETAIDLIKQLDEPRKVKVKQFVADWYERNENDLDYKIWDYIYNWEDQEESEFKNWFNCSKKAFQTLVNMHQFGYEVEKEKQYLVKIKATKHYLVKDGNGKIFFSLAFKGYFTKKELEEADFGWVFDCPGIEIEEVE